MKIGNWVIGGLGNWIIDARRRRGRSTQLPNSPIIQLPNSTIQERGFTLIELVVVTSLIVILASLALVQYRQSIVRTREAVLKDDLFKMRDALDQYHADKNQYPSALSALAAEGYLRAIPKDPFTDSDTTWQEIFDEPDPNNPGAPPGVKDVRSGSDATALDGSKYADW